MQDTSSYLYYTSTDTNTLPIDSNYGELPDGRDIYPTYTPQDSVVPNAPIWEVVGKDEGQGMGVKAGIMSHGVPTVGYVLEEGDR